MPHSRFAFPALGSFLTATRNQAVGEGIQNFCEVMSKIEIDLFRQSRVGFLMREIRNGLLNRGCVQNNIQLRSLEKLAYLLISDNPKGKGLFSKSKGRSPQFNDSRSSSDKKKFLLVEKLRQAVLDEFGPVTEHSEFGGPLKQKLDSFVEMGNILRGHYEELERYVGFIRHDYRVIDEIAENWPDKELRGLLFAFANDLETADEELELDATKRVKRMWISYQNRKSAKRAESRVT